MYEGINIVMRSFATYAVAIAASISLTACGGGPVLSIGKPTIDLNSEESSKQLETIMGEDCKVADTPETASLEEEDEALKAYFRCMGEKVDGVTLTMSGIALEAMGQVPIIEKEIPEFVMLSVGNNNSLLMPTFAIPGAEEPLAPYNMSFVCPRSTSGCSEVKKGDKVSLTAEFDTEIAYLPTEGMPVAVVSEVTIN